MRIGGAETPMMNNVCKICSKVVVANNHFWREHKLREADYYLQYYPKVSKLTGEPIKFKSREFYLNSDFNDKREMSVWFKENPIEARTYALQLLINRKESKGIKYAPSQVELRSLMMPTMIWFDRNWENYNEACAKAGLIEKFDLYQEPLAYGNIKDEATIVIDTREQLPFKFSGYNTVVKKLDYGDYALEPNKFKLHVERKSLSDFVGTLGTGFDRFCREIKRAKKDRAYLVVLVESSLSNALNFNYLPKLKYVLKSSPDYIFHNVRKIMQSYDNVQFLFSECKTEANNALLKLFSMKRHPKHFDLQYKHELKEI